jgi:DNA-binding transcriptional ArsR family regulator
VDPVIIHACLADPIRYRMVHLLLHGPLCVKHLQALLSVGQVSVSKHLGYLKQRSLVEVRRHRNLRAYSLPASRPPTLAAHLECLRSCAANDEVCQGDLLRREALRPTIHRDLAGESARTRPPRKPASPLHPPPPSSWPSVEDGPLLD